MRESCELFVMHLTNGSSLAGTGLRNAWHACSTDHCRKSSLLPTHRLPHLVSSGSGKGRSIVGRCWCDWVGSCNWFCLSKTIKIHSSLNGFLRFSSLTTLCDTLSSTSLSSQFSGLYPACLRLLPSSPSAPPVAQASIQTRPGWRRESCKYTARRRDSLRLTRDI